jgi:hypothetical protein
MATITPNTTYPNGTVLSVGGHNANVYSTTAGRGIMSEPNGGLNINNLDPTFTLRDEHVMPEEAVFARSDSSTAPMDVYNNAFGVRDDEDPSYVPVAGLCERVYLPYSVSVALWQWSFYVAPWHAYLFRKDTGDADIPPMSLRVFLDGVELSAYRRDLPIGAEIIEDIAAGTSFLENYEQLVPLWFDVSKMATNVAAGFHDLTVKLYLPRVTFNPGNSLSGSDADELEVPISGVVFSPGDTDPISYYQCSVHSRITLGTRSVRCVMFR